jgi:hypothetical protein
MHPPPNTSGEESKKRSENKQTGFFARHEWTLVGLLAVLAFVLGCIGFARTLQRVECAR